MRKVKGYDEVTETTTVWSFPQRGSWVTHNSDYRGNFAPQIATNVILRYSKEGDLILDPMVGGGTTLIEAKLLNRRAIGLDINPEAVKRAQRNITFKGDYKYEPEVKIGDVRTLNGIKNESVDLILTHPPYLNIINYSNGKIKGDLSNIGGVKKFCYELEKGIAEFFRVLKEDCFCAVLIGDTRRNRHYIPLSSYVLKRFLKQGFALREDVIKIQHNCKSNPYWQKMSEEFNILLIAHEHLYIFRKPRSDENLSRIRYSIIS
ncbi:MAG: DNA methyltransferase [Candidatus Krumholzibacteriota bacterium]|nr:DNA methyltransferase [Candidatus Krumholzibacteriota bacterium]